MTLYKDYIIETFENPGEASKNKIRAKPLPSQGVSTSRRVECSEGMRYSHEIGTCFKVKCKVTDREGSIFLYRHYKWDYEVIPRKEAEEYIKRHFNES